MASVRSTANKSTEKAFISILSKARITGWRRKSAIFGNPDFVFPPYRIAVFVDGCFWHHCLKHCRIPSTNVDYWINKIMHNAKRDRQVTIELRKRSWHVIRFWEHDLKGGRGFTQKMNRLKKLIQER